MDELSKHMGHRMKLLTFLLLLVIGGAQSVSAQVVKSAEGQQYPDPPQHFVISNESDITLHGTSNLHDWDMDVGHIEGFLHTALPNPTDQLPTHISIELSLLEVPVKSIHNDSDGMTEKTHKALGGNKFPNISYELKGVDLSNTVVNLEDSLAQNLTTFGMLTIKDVTKELLVPINVVGKKNHIEINGEFTVDMTNFNVKPPTAFFGAIKSGKEITIKFNLHFEPSACPVLAGDDISESDLSQMGEQERMKKEQQDNNQM